MKTLQLKTQLISKWSKKPLIRKQKMKELNLTQLNHISPFQSQAVDCPKGHGHAQFCIHQFQSTVTGSGLIEESLYVGLHFAGNFVDKIGHKDYSFASTVKQSAALSFAVGFTLLEIHIGLRNSSQYDERVNQLISGL